MIDKDWIKKADYKMLLDYWRFAPIGDPVFRGELGDFYTQELARKKAALSPREVSLISKELGWEE